MPQADWDTDEGLEEIAKFCRNGFPVRSGIERLRNAHDTDRRVEYFRGEKLTIFLLGDLDDDDNGKKKKKQKGRPFTAKDTEEARNVVTSMMAAGYIHRATRVGKGQLEWEPKQTTEPQDSYAMSGTTRASEGLQQLHDGAAHRRHARLHVLPDLAPLPQSLSLVPQCCVLDLHEHLLHIEDVTIYELLGFGLMNSGSCRFVRRVATFAESMHAGRKPSTRARRVRDTTGRRCSWARSRFLRGLIINPRFRVRRSAEGVHRRSRRWEVTHGF